MDTKNKVQDRTKWKKALKNKEKGDHRVAVFEKKKKKKKKKLGGEWQSGKKKKKNLKKTKK